MPSAISSSVVPFSSCSQSLPASESFPMSQLFASGGQSTGVSALASFLPKNTQGWSPLEWTGWSPCSPRDSQESSPTPQFKSINSSGLSFLHSPTLHIHTWPLEKPIALTRWTFVGKVMSLLLNMLSRLVIAFLLGSKNLLISWLQVTICNDFGAQENQVCHCFPIYLPWSDGIRCHDLSFLNVEF